MYSVSTRVNLLDVRSSSSRSCLARSLADCSRLQRNSRSWKDCCCRRCDSARLLVWVHFTIYLESGPLQKARVDKARSLWRMDMWNSLQIGAQSSNLYWPLHRLSAHWASWDIFLVSWSSSSRNWTPVPLLLFLLGWGLINEASFVVGEDCCITGIPSHTFWRWAGPLRSPNQLPAIGERPNAQRES